MRLGDSAMLKISSSQAELFHEKCQLPFGDDPMETSVPQLSAWPDFVVAGHVILSGKVRKPKNGRMSSNQEPCAILVWISLSRNP